MPQPDTTSSTIRTNNHFRRLVFIAGLILILLTAAGVYFVYNAVIDIQPQETTTEASPSPSDSTGTSELVAPTPVEENAPKPEPVKGFEAQELEST